MKTLFRRPSHDKEIDSTRGKGQKQFLVRRPGWGCHRVEGAECLTPMRNGTPMGETEGPGPSLFGWASAVCKRTAGLPLSDAARTRVASVMRR
jgi:hypothetical protein